MSLCTRVRVCVSMCVLRTCRQKQVVSGTTYTGPPIAPQWGRIHHPRPWSDGVYTHVVQTQQMQLYLLLHTAGFPEAAGGDFTNAEDPTEHVHKHACVYTSAVMCIYTEIHTCPLPPHTLHLKSPCRGLVRHPPSLALGRTSSSKGTWPDTDGFQEGMMPCSGGRGTLRKEKQTGLFGMLKNQQRHT